MVKTMACSLTTMDCVSSIYSQLNVQNFDHPWISKSKLRIDIIRVYGNNYNICVFGMNLGIIIEINEGVQVTVIKISKFIPLFPKIQMSILFTLLILFGLIPLFASGETILSLILLGMIILLFLRLIIYIQSGQKVLIDFIENVLEDKI